MNAIGLLLAHRLTAALGSVPDRAAWLTSGSLALLLTALAVPLGVRCGFLRWRPLREPWPTLTGIVIVSLITPALAEELAFRVLLLPGHSEHRSGGALIFSCLISLQAFVSYQPLKKWLLPACRNTPFADPTFLSLAMLLGVVCTASFVTSGSLWAPVVLHWLFVSGWLLLLGGWEKMGHNRSAA